MKIHLTIEIHPDHAVRSNLANGNPRPYVNCRIAITPIVRIADVIRRDLNHVLRGQCPHPAIAYRVHFPISLHITFAGFTCNQARSGVFGKHQSGTVVLIEGKGADMDAAYGIVGRLEQACRKALVSYALYQLSNRAINDRWTTSGSRD